MNALDRIHPRVERADALRRAFAVVAARPYPATLATTPKPVLTSARRSRGEVQRSRGMQ
jgi:hypothetical protein